MKEIINIIDTDDKTIKEKSKSIKDIIKSLKTNEPPKEKEKKEPTIKEEVVIKEKEIAYEPREYTANELKWKEVFNMLSGAKNE